MKINDSVRILVGLYVGMIGDIVEVSGDNWFRVHLPNGKIIGYDITEIELA